MQWSLCVVLRSENEPFCPLPARDESSGSFAPVVFPGMPSQGTSWDSAGDSLAHQSSSSSPMVHGSGPPGLQIPNTLGLALMPLPSCGAVTVALGVGGERTLSLASVFSAQSRAISWSLYSRSQLSPKSPRILSLFLFLLMAPCPV